MGPGEATADIARYGNQLSVDLLERMDPLRGGFEQRACVDAAAHLLLWRHYMVTGQPQFGEAVVASLRAICTSSLVAPSWERTLGEDAIWLELLTWVWRQVRCPELRHHAEAIATSTLERTRRPGFGFAARGLGDERDDSVRPDHNGLMLVALIEAGSVFDRRDWLALARQAFDEISDGVVTAGRLDDYAMVSRAAIRLFEAFGKPRYLALAQAWVSTLDEAFWDAGTGGYRLCTRETTSPCDRSLVQDATLPSGNALMIGVLARLHALTDRACYLDRAEGLVEAFHDTISRSGIAAATAVAGTQTLAQLVSIKVAGDPKLAETRELMRAALDYGLPDRLVLGPGAGDPGDASPQARVRLCTRCLAPITDVAQLRDLTAPGGLSRIDAT